MFEKISKERVKNSNHNTRKKKKYIHTRPIKSLADYNY